MSNFEIFIACFLTFWAIVFSCLFIFGWFNFKKEREKSIKEFKERTRWK